MVLYLDIQHLALNLARKRINSESLYRHSYAKKFWSSIQIWSVSINKYTATNNHRINQIIHKPQDLLVNTSSATRCVARNFIRAGENNNRVSTFKYFNAPCFSSIINEACMFLAFPPEQLCSDLSRQIKSLLSFNWQGSKVLTVKFQAFTLDQCHHLLINLSCKSASEPVNAQYYTWARSNRGRQYGWACFLYLHASDLHQHSTFTKAKEQHCSEALIPKLAFYKTFTPMRCGSRCHLVFERLIHVCSW